VIEESGIIAPVPDMEFEISDLRFKIGDQRAAPIKSSIFNLEFHDPD
jgi:hypothetical protein